MPRTPEFDFDAPPPAPTREDRDVYTPGRLNREARMLLERGLPALWLEGEISNLSRPSSGHWYFSLKDEAAQLRCAMFRQRNLLTRFSPKDGMHVLLRGRVSLYEPRGDYQFIADHMEEAGEGALRRRFELLKNKLAAEGLFGTEHKRSLPRLPKRIGVITSPTGAAIRDVLNILRRRFCTIPVLIYPVQVQGAAAAGQIARMIRLASARAECDVLILARGGGSLEDLWAFNEEVVARAIYDCQVPLVSGVGHEVDFTIADFVADVRAPTPSGAAELVAPDCNEWTRALGNLARRMARAVQRTTSTRQDGIRRLERRLLQQHPGVHARQQMQRVDEMERRMLRAMARGVSAHTDDLRRLERRLQQLHPGVQLRQKAQRLAELERRLLRCARHTVTSASTALRHLDAHLQRCSPAPRIAAARGRLMLAHARLNAGAERRVAADKARLDAAAGALHLVSPLATLQRGYSIVTDARDRVVTSASQLAPGEVIRARVAKGVVQARVERTEDGE